jgi:predicted anti-sigma-YlaC factor YlaD
MFPATSDGETRTIRHVNSRLFWLAIAVQAAAVGVVAGILIALPLSHDFFKDWGFVVGPLAWLLCSLVTARVLSLPVGYVLFAAVAGGVAGTIVMLVASHWPGIAAGLLVFAASCGSYVEEGEEQLAR